ncbi:MAG TPA: GGDEF domain-containing protein [Solirubrobacteraceae bacterium]|nr:GGDEF domain-containing protein [Solirubrobacteraceae bacterium]
MPHTRASPLHSSNRRPLSSRGRIVAVRSIVDGLTARRPAIVWSLSLLFLFKGFVGVLAAFYPISASEPVMMVGGVGAIAVLCAATIWLVGWRIPLLGFELIAATGSIIASWLVAQSATHGGMMVAAFAYPWIAIYSAHFFPRRGVIVQGVLMSVGFSVGLLLSGLSDIVVYWTIVVATIWSICIVLGNLSEHMRLQAGTDHLTGLLNRNGFQIAALRERALADRTGSPLTLAVLDLDGFKQINDREGHAAGDRLLAGLGRAWRARVRPGDILARHGGDEFVLLLPATTSTGAEAVLDRLRDDQDPVGWSVGVSEWQTGESLEVPMARADGYLYGVKSAQRAEQAAEQAEGEYRAGALLSLI